MMTFTQKKVAIVVATLVIGIAPIASNALAASSHSHSQAHKSTQRMKDDCKAKSWEIPTQTQGTPEMATACPMHGA